MNLHTGYKDEDDTVEMNKDEQARSRSDERGLVNR